MSNRTFKVIVILVGLLFLNIEAAQAGLVQKVKVFILHEFSDYQLLYISLAMLAIGFIAYVMLAPVIIGNKKSAWLDYFPQPAGSSYQDKKEMVKKISSMLSNS